MRGNVKSAALRSAGVVLGLMLSLRGAGAQASVARSTPLQQMAAEARVTKDQARMTALSRVPGGRMSTIELHRGIMGKLVYTAIISENGKMAKTEVVVDAMTGVVLSKRP